jgi:DNA replication licensing factor MCM6
MDSDGPSSPIAMPSSLPPSSAPDPLPLTNDGTPRRPIADALAMGDIEAEEDNNEGTANRKRKRPRQVNGDVPIVKDAVGESVADSFETFLKT